MSHPGPLRRARGWEPGAAQPPRSIAPSTARDRTRPPARTPRPGQRGPRVPAGTCQGLVHRVAHRSARRSAGRPGLRRAMDSARLPPPRSAPPPPRPARPRRCCCCRLPAAFPARPGPSPPVPAALRPARGSNGAEEPQREAAGGKRGPGSFREDPATAGNYFLPLSLRKEKKDISISPLEKKMEGLESRGAWLAIPALSSLSAKPSQKVQGALGADKPKLFCPSVPFAYGVTLDEPPCISVTRLPHLGMEGISQSVVLANSLLV